MKLSYLVLEILLATPLCIRATSATVTFHFLKNSRLCNNANTPGQVLNETKCRIHKEPESAKQMEARGPYTLCDSRSISDEKCRVVAVEMNSFNYSSFLNLVPSIDTDISIRRIEVKMNSEEIEIDSVGKEIDQFLTPRPWWYVVKEPYHWNKHTHRIIVLDRVQHGRESSLRTTAALQYPRTNLICNSSPMTVQKKDFLHPGWYSVFASYMSTRKEYPFVITGMYVSIQNSVNDSTAFISSRDCPSTVNKWECAFLQSTNCPIPNIVSQCHRKNCVQLLPMSVRNSVLFNASRAEALPVPQTRLEILKKATKKPPPDNGPLLSEMVKASKAPHHRVLYLEPYNISQAKFSNVMLTNGDSFIYSFLLRYSSLYRSKIAQKIKDFRTAHNFTVSTRCVAAQIRRGDRVMSGVNMTHYCLTTPRNKLNTDMGCEEVPYASVTLKHVLDSAPYTVGPGVKTLIVTTDDELWLEEQRRLARKTHPDWRVLSLSSPKDSRGQVSYDTMRYRAGTASGVLLFSSLEISRQCEGFVGHFGCGGTMLVYKSLCAQHRQYEYVCPPSFDVRTIKELRIPWLRYHPAG